MTKKILYTGFIILTLLAAGCKKGLLDKVPKDSLSDEIVWENPATAEQFINGIYGLMISGFERQEQDWGCGLWMLDDATDDGSMCYDWTAATNFNKANYGPSNSPLFNQWGAYYSLVRKCNLALANLGRVQGNDAMKERLKGEAYFLRAYIYQELLRFYGLKSTGSSATGVPIIKQPLQPTDNFQIARSSYDETVNFIVSDLDSATLLLPGVDAVEAGRASTGAALALKSRVLLYAEQWANAAAAAKAVMDLSPGYSLYPDYKALFLDKNNPEIIFAKKFAAPAKAHGSDGLGYTPGWDVVNTVSGGSFGGGWGGTCPTQNLVDAYEMTDGKPYNESSLYDPANPYQNRDPRFYATVLTNGSLFRGGIVETFAGGSNTAAGGAQDATKTSYYIRKFHNEAAVLYSTGGDEDWIFIRYAEVLLNYAEAQNEAVGPDASVYDAVNQVRARPGVNMPPLTASLSQAQMRESIRNERRVEFAFEEQRFFDVRRWGIANEVLNQPVYGMSIIKNGSTYTYNRVAVDDRTYTGKMAVLPIPQVETVKNPACTQIAGW